MPLPALYLEGLTQHALRGREQLNTYKIGLIEAILKEALRVNEERELLTIRSAVQTALEVVRWEMQSDGR